MRSQSVSYHGYRFPPDIISHAVWLYYRFCLSFRDAEDLLAQRGVTVTYETIRQWCQRFGPVYARQLRRRRGGMGDTWHLDEVFVLAALLTANVVADLGLAQLMAAGRVRGDWELALAFSVVPVIGVVYALALLRTARGTAG